MALEFEFPDTGEGVTEGKFLEWLVDEGEEIEEDQVVGEAETDKAVIDIPAPADGTIKELKVEPGDNVKVGEVIMILDTEDDSGESDEEESSEEPQEAEEQETSNTEPEEKEEVELEAPETEDTSTGSSENILALPKVRKVAEEKGVNLASIKTGERITEEEVLKAADSASPETAEETTEKKTEPEKKEEISSDTSIPDTSNVDAMPSVRKLAREKDIDITQIDGSGRGGKITREDVLNVEETGAEDSEEPRQEDKEGSAEAVKQNSEQDEERVEMSGIRKMTAEKMKESKFSAPHVTHVDKADVTQLVELREEEKDDLDVHLTYLPFIMKAAAIALQEYPELNAELDDENYEIILKKHYDFNIAVDTDRGLLIPLIEDVDQKNIIELAEEVGDMAGKAKHGELSPNEMSNGTFSITNLGVLGGEAFTPIINYPQTAILGVGEIQETAEVVDSEVAPRHTVKLSLSYDHRVVDGATAARFMNKIIENLEDPGKMLIEL